MNTTHKITGLLFTAFAGCLFVAGCASPTPIDELLPAATLADAFDENLHAAMERFGGRTIEIMGSVTTIGDDSFFVSGGDDSFSFGSVQCNFADRVTHARKAELREGQKVRVRGVCVGKQVYPVLEDAVFGDLYQ